MSLFTGTASAQSASNDISLKDKAIALIESIETGDQSTIAYINPDKYIQHNPLVADGLEGFAEVLKNKPEQGFKAEVLRAFQDGDYVVTHTKYDFFGPKSGIDIFRFEDGLIVEHWDNLLAVQPPNAGGRTQFDGETERTDLDKTEENKKLVKAFYDVVILGGQMERLGEFFHGDTYIQHNPLLPDGVSGFLNGVKGMMEQGIEMRLEKLHMLLGQGNFVLGVAEGTFAGKPYAFYDLFRIKDEKLAEHWDIMAEIPPESDWKNTNGKF